MNLYAIRHGEAENKNLSIYKTVPTSKIELTNTGQEQIKNAAEGLARAKGFMRSHLARELGMRATPDLVFKLDLSMVHQQEMEMLLKEIKTDVESSETGS